MTEKDEENGARQANLFSFGENTLSSMKETTTTVREYRFVEPLRKCRKCGVLKPLREFYREKSTERGKIKKHRRICRECDLHRGREWRKDNPEKYKEGWKRWREVNHERALETNRSWREANREKALKSSKRWQKENLEKVREYTFLNSAGRKARSGYLYGTGVCMLCGKMEPRVLINHHLFPDCNLLISLCADCHRMYHTGDQEIHMRTIQIAIEKTPFLWKDMKISRNVEIFKSNDTTIAGTISGFDGKQIKVVKSMTQERIQLK